MTNERENFRSFGVSCLTEQNEHEVSDILRRSKSTEDHRPKRRGKIVKLNSKPCSFSFSIFLGAMLVVAFTAVGVQAEDWKRFLGENGAATSADADLPTNWDAETNVAWKTELPGPGASSPIVVGDRVFLTCYSGYGVGKGGGKDIEKLTRHLVCFDKKSGLIKWERSVNNSGVKDEDPYKSYITQHGYATNTPISDGNAVYVFFGKPGLLAFDLDGNELWRKPIEHQVNETRWGSAASPILYGDQLIVNAVEECGKIFSISKKNGEQKWEFDTQSKLAYATPNLAKNKAGETELIVAVPNKVIGLNADTGKEKWYVTNNFDNEVNGSILVDDDIVFVYGGFRSVGSMAIRTGGEGDVTKSHVLWHTRDTSYVATPVLKEGHIYWVGETGIAHCVNAETGKRIYRKRLTGVRGGRGIKFFASMVVAGDHMFAASRRSGTFVLETKPEFNLVSQNVIAGDESEFNGTPAIADDCLYIRSNKFLYCITKNKEQGSGNQSE